MAKREAPADEVIPALASLPPGRHGLSREFVVENQRGRLTAGMIAAVVGEGYHDCTITSICAAAGVSRRAFYGYFKGKQDCFDDTYSKIEDHVLSTMRDAGEAPRGYPAKLRARLGALLGTFAENPDLARYTMIAARKAGGEQAARYRRFLAAILTVIGEGLPRGAKHPSPATEEGLLGALAALVEREVKAGRGESLGALEPEFSLLILSAYVGRTQAHAALRA
jgi:AcrR family transcriptional regulator